MHEAALFTAEYFPAVHGVHEMSLVSVQVEPVATESPGAQTLQGAHAVAPVAAHEEPSTQGVQTLSVVAEQAEERTAPAAHVAAAQGTHGCPLADHEPAAQARQEAEGTSHA